MINGARLKTEKQSIVQDCPLRNDKWCKIENWEMINGARSNTEQMINSARSEKWLLDHKTTLLIISQYSNLHRWSFLSFQSCTVNRLIVSQFPILHVDRFSPPVVSQFSIWHHWSFVSHEKHEVLNFRGYVEEDRAWKWIFKVDIRPFKKG